MARRTLWSLPFLAVCPSFLEHLDYFSNPEYVGRSLNFSCRVEGDAWYQEGEFPLLQGGQQTGSVQLAEVWRRIG